MYLIQDSVLSIFYDEQIHLLSLPFKKKNMEEKLMGGEISFVVFWGGRNDLMKY